jgi:hypothetical protein
MATTNTNQEIRTRIDSFLTALSDLVRKAALASVHEVLGEGATRRHGPGRPRGGGLRGPGRPRKTDRRTRRLVARSGKRIRRSSADLEAVATRVLAYVKANAGYRLEQIGNPSSRSTTAANCQQEKGADRDVPDRRVEVARPPLDGGERQTLNQP